MTNKKKKIPVRLCLFCEHFLMSYMIGDYSDVTPGDGLEIRCFNGEVSGVYELLDEYELESGGTDAYRKAILRAVKCPGFEVVGGEDGSVARYLRGEGPP